MAKRGYVEQLCFPSDESGRNKKYRLALVRVPGEDDFEVGLRAVYRLMGRDSLDNDSVMALLECRPETITFDGSFITYPLRHHNIEITNESAEEWVHRLNSKTRMGA
jgi:hypothetical protein